MFTLDLIRAVDSPGRIYYPLPAQCSSVETLLERGLDAILFRLAWTLLVNLSTRPYWTKKRAGRGSRNFAPRTPCDHYRWWIDNILTLDCSDYRMRKSHAKLTRCSTYQQAVNGDRAVWSYYDPCGRPDCFSCRLSWKKKEVRKFTPARHDVVRAMDVLYTERAAGRLTRSIPGFTLSYVTVNLFACPLDAEPDEIVAAGTSGRAMVRSMVQRAEALLGLDDGAIAVFGHLECSPPKWTSEVDPYLFRERDRDLRGARGQQWTVLHWHGWVVAPIGVDVVRNAFSAVLSGPRRVCFRDRHYLTETLDVSIGCLHYGISHLHSIKADVCGDDDEALFWLTRWSLYLRGDGLRGIRVHMNLQKVVPHLTAWWLKWRDVVFSLFDDLDRDVLARMPAAIIEEYRSLRSKPVEPSSCDGHVDGHNDGHDVVRYNWCSPRVTVFLVKMGSFTSGTHFCGVGFHARAPPC